MNEELKEVTMPSGAILKIDMAPFAVSKNLYQAVLEEMKGLKLEGSQEIDVNMYKDLICVALGSKKIEAALNECFKRCLYNGLKITGDTFEKAEARQDYMMVCWEVAKENIAPFLKSLYAQYGAILGTLNPSRA